MEIDADREGLNLMAHAGYHPHFVPALHHLLHAATGATSNSLTSMHPCWEERDRELLHAYVEASIEFQRRWPEWYASPGGNPPIVVFVDDPVLKKSHTGTWEVQVSMRCENLAGAVEVVLDYHKSIEGAEPSPEPNEVRQVSGCTSPRSTVRFLLDPSLLRHSPKTLGADIYVLDAWGAVLARADVGKLPH